MTSWNHHAHAPGPFSVSSIIHLLSDFWVTLPAPLYLCVEAMTGHPTGLSAQRASRAAALAAASEPHLHICAQAVGSCHPGTGYSREKTRPFLGAQDSCELHQLSRTPRWASFAFLCLHSTLTCLPGATPASLRRCPPNAISPGPIQPHHLLLENSHYTAAL